LTAHQEVSEVCGEDLGNQHDYTHLVLSVCFTDARNRMLGNCTKHASPEAARTYPQWNRGRTASPHTRRQFAGLTDRPAAGVSQILAHYYSVF
jgi:hypothetical protein